MFKVVFPILRKFSFETRGVKCDLNEADVWRAFSGNRFCPPFFFSLLFTLFFFLISSLQVLKKVGHRRRLISFRFQYFIISSASIAFFGKNPLRTMVVNKKRQIIRQSYTSSSSMEKALRSAKRSKKSLLAISREFGVGYNALRRRVRGEVDPKAKTG